MLGCQHIEQVFQNERSKEGVIKTCNAARYMISHFARKEKYTYAMKCSECHEINAGSNFMCLQCGFSGCWNNGHFLSHSKKVGHVFGINSSNGLLFCFKCGDYIGSNELIAASMLNKYWDDVVTKTHIPMLEHRDGLRGLLNMGSTCFMSSIVQCLIHNPYFFQFSINQLHSQQCPLQDPSSCISCALDKIVWDFYGHTEAENLPKERPNRRSEYSGFIGLLISSWKINENLAGYFQQDAHEYWQFLLNQLHNDYMVCHNKSVENTSYSDSCDCLAHCAFQGYLKSSIVCRECQLDSKTTIDPFMDLSLDIKDKSNLYECLDSFHRKERLHDFDYHCKRCNTSQNAIKRLIIHKLPAVLVLQLKRFEQHLNGNSVKLNDFVEFPLYLNMSSYCDSSDCKGDVVPDILYELIGIIAHRGTVNEGHYIAFTKVSSGQWFKFNDSMVSSITEEELLREQAYLLFYVVNQVN